MSFDFLRPCDPLISPILYFFRGAFKLDEDDLFDTDNTLPQSVKDMLKLDAILVQKYPPADKVLVEIARLYVEKTGRSLSDVLGLRLKGWLCFPSLLPAQLNFFHSEKEILFGELARALVLPSIEYDAYELHYAIE
ncbi:hypothetical protein HK096_002091, partial [Nowakowskiella sp. JEL0078]